MNSKSLKSTLAVAALGWTSTASAAAWGTVAYKKADIPLLGCGACILAGLSYTSNTDDAWKVYVGYGAYPQKTENLPAPSKNPQVNYDCAASYFNSQVTKGGSGFDPAVHSWTIAPSVNNYFLLAQCPFVTAACAGRGIDTTTPFAALQTPGTGQRYTGYTTAGAGLAYEVPLTDVPVGTACTYIVAAKGAFPTIQFLPTVGNPSLYVQILEFDAGEVSTVAASTADPILGQVPAAGQPADLFLGADWGGVSGRAGMRGDWAPWVQFVADPNGGKTPAFRNVFPEDVERQFSLYRQRALAYTAGANTYKALWLDWSQETQLAVALGQAPADGSEAPKQPQPPMGVPAPYGGLLPPVDLKWPSNDVQVAQASSPTAATYVYGGWGSPIAKDYDLSFDAANTLPAGWTVYGAMGQDVASKDISKDYVGLSLNDAQDNYGGAAGPDAYLLATVVYLRAGTEAGKFRYQTGAGMLGTAATKFDAWTEPSVPVEVDLSGLGAGYLAAAVTASAVTLAALTLF